MKQFHYNGHVLTWEEHSGGEHTFVLIPGWSGVRPIWQRTVDRLKTEGRCVTLDLPAHYPAQAPLNYNELTQEQLLDLETQAVKHICGEGPLTLIGHSTGGLISIGIAARLPTQVKRVVTVNGVVWGPLHGVLGLAQWMISHHLYPLYYALWRATQIAPLTVAYGLMYYTHRRLAYWTNRTTWRTSRTIYPWYRQQSLANLAILLRTLESCDIRTLSTSVHMPVLAITGSQDPIVPVHQAIWLREHLCNVDVRVLDDVGHAPFIEAPDQFERLLLDWLASHPV